MTEEPIHHTIPLLAARLSRHEDYLDSILGFLDDVTLERIECTEEEVENLVVGVVTLKGAYEWSSTQLKETREVVQRQTEDIVILTTRASVYEQRLEESRARERAQDDQVADLSEMIRQL